MVDIIEHCGCTVPCVTVKAVSVNGMSDTLVHRLVTLLVHFCPTVIMLQFSGEVWCVVFNIVVRM